MKKAKALVTVAIIYLFAYAAGVFASLLAEDLYLRFFLFDIAATLVTFVFSVILRNSSVYDPYWSLTPMVMSVWLFVEKAAFSPFNVVLLAVFNVWSLRLTLNWVTVFTDFSYEDWRYRKFRDENPPALWFFINLTGIHYVPTLVVFAGMLPLFAAAETELGIMSLFGCAVIAAGVLLEFFADRQMHGFLSRGGKEVCREGLWRYSRHPNYLGEMTVWVGVYLAVLPYAVEKWYFCVGLLAMILLFNIVSVPLAEKRQLKRREAYKEYCRVTSRLLILPVKKK